MRAAELLRVEREVGTKMSFSSEVKEELSRHLGKSRHCQIAELAALIAFEGKICVSESENQLLKEKYELLVKRLLPEAESKNAIAGEGPSGQKRSVSLAVEKAAGAEWDMQKRIFSAVKMWNEAAGKPEVTDTVNGMLIQQICCRRAFIRGAFLAGGSISDPNKSYHFEIVCRSEAQAGQLQEIINSFGMDAKIVARKKYQVVYLKEGAQIVDILNVMEAHVALMNLENVRILKEMRNSVNRKVNCETANISKTVNAAVKQLEDIAYIRDKAGLSSLPDNLREMALLRLERPDTPLKELGTYLDPPVGKSGVNHRLRRISEIADQLRDKEVNSL